MSAESSAIRRAALSLLAVLSACLLGSTPVIHSPVHSNTHPIIFVHGLGGWGGNRVAENSYWGGAECLGELLRAHGYRVYIARVGPFSSNWDRAIELYYQIRGGQVDYGEAHSRRHGHAQRPEGKYYDEPLYPQWSSKNPVHLVGHSMGGQTIRKLSALMAGRAPKFRDVLRNEDGRPFTPGYGWIASITTISTPHNGSSLVDLIDNPVAAGIAVAALSGIQLTGLADRHGYDLELEQWGISPGEKESLYAYLHRMMSTLGNSTDFSIYELSTEGATRFNRRVNLNTMDSQAWHFSISNRKTKAVFKNIMCVPSVNMHPALYPFSLTICNSPLWTDPLDIGRDWRHNDGLVNTASMPAPVAGAHDPRVEYTGVPVKNAWNHLECLHMDHFEIIGQNIAGTEQSRQKLNTLYLELCEMLYRLE